MSSPSRWIVPLQSVGLWSWCGTNPWLDGTVECGLPWRRAGGASGIVGWGLRESGRRAEVWAAREGVDVLRLEDGFLRSVSLGVLGDTALSIVIDDLGIYYDARRPSRLEALVKASIATAGDAAHTSSNESSEAGRAIALIVSHGLSKYNHAPDFVPPKDWRDDAVLVIDQTRGDVAVSLGGADDTSFRAMLAAALAENPGKPVWIKTHPDVMCGKKSGYLVDETFSDPRVRLLPADVSPPSLLKRVGKVYAVSSQMGFEALLCGKPVVTFGLPWYAGWGLTDDRHVDAPVVAARRGSATLHQLFGAAYLQYCRYVNPETGKRGTIFDVIAYLAKQRRLNEVTRGELVCIGLSLWKRSVVAPFLRHGGARVRFVDTPAALRRLPPDASRRVVLWGARHPESAAVAQKLGLPVLRMEDGFIRSVGLGSNLIAPLSLVVDDLGIYFDPRTPSRLEAILERGGFDDAELAEAHTVRTALVDARIGKYNVGEGGVALPSPRPAKVILVPGQVEDDASIRTGSPWISTNLDLLTAVRAAHPDAFIVFKPHPDVVSGNRKGAIAPHEALRLADVVAPESDVIACVEQADEVHTMTSLTGFEALLRGKRVVCYGAPFYAGWGLTHDVFGNAPHHGQRAAIESASRDSHPVWARRRRRLMLDELIVGTLLRYPRYVHPGSRAAIDAHCAIALLHAQRQSVGQGKLRRNRLMQQSGKVKMWARTTYMEYRDSARKRLYMSLQRWLAKL
ncbi:capsular polysaccharide biosynthesis protein [Burkholderia sp. Ac-20384]|uniref:capsular polysaccharide biosynthesis protein n=1 Tax=Burkholderia sp. Ac-20384 TaxID=2703902 RepID=UPI00197D04FA|nr:capsular polysaccharide biosynthesis protein [Burkholderia sp. Ac-20384]MBN3823114.1 capsular polysaccharide biosynthesis protein [Burkholderia sp. Ac-20384]